MAPSHRRYRRSSGQLVEDDEGDPGRNNNVNIVQECRHDDEHDGHDCRADDGGAEHLVRLLELADLRSVLGVVSRVREVRR